MSALKDKVALVTGAGSGFGSGIAESFIDAGATVGLLDLNLAAAADIAKRLGSRAVALEGDVTSESSMREAVTLLEDNAGALDIVVNNAGIGLPPTAMEDVSADDFQRVCDVNMRSIYVCGRVIVPAFKNRQRGAILNIASTAGVSPRPNLTWYNASKGWVITATKSMAIELAPFNIRVNALNPVAGETPLLATFMGEDTPEQRAAFLNSIPLGRFSTPADLGAAAVFLCGDDAGLITGVALEIDGGRCI
ncbi:MAG: glucose 1-dehydrogenase [Pseudomonadaceae bacterium]|nr:glucose 1-dehydrogenase [Pseudomonadaceae bacterium]